MRKILVLILIAIAFVGLSISCNQKSSIRCGNIYESDILNRLHCGKFFIENYEGLKKTMISDTIVLASKIENTPDINPNFCSFHFQRNTIRIVDYTLAKKEVIELDGIEYDSRKYENISYNGLFVIDENTMSISLSKIHQDAIEINKTDTINVLKSIENPIDTEKNYSFKIKEVRIDKKTNFCKLILVKK